MKSIIEEIYVNFLFNENLKPSAGHRKYFDKFCDEYDKLIKVLPEELKPQFDKVMNLRDKMEDEAGLDGFKYGFEIGAKIGTEVFSK